MQGTICFGALTIIVLSAVLPAKAMPDYSSDEDYWDKDIIDYDKTDESEAISSPKISDSEERIPDADGDPEHYLRKQGDDNYNLTDSSTSEERHDTEELPNVTEDKLDCRRVKFASENPKIELVISVNTNVVDCLVEGQAQTHANEVVLTDSKKTPKSHDIIVYHHTYFRGPSTEITLERGKCSNVDGEFDDQISSIDRKGGCVMIYEDFNCEGNFAKLRPESDIISQDLLKIAMNDIVSSLKLC